MARAMKMSLYLCECVAAQRSMRMRADTETLCITDHYLNYPDMLVRLSMGLIIDSAAFSIIWSVALIGLVSCLACYVSFQSA
jgi:hypothetical protein